MPWYPDAFSGPALAGICGGERPAVVSVLRRSHGTARRATPQAKHN